MSSKITPWVGQKDQCIKVHECYGKGCCAHGSSSACEEDEDIVLYADKVEDEFLCIDCLLSYYDFLRECEEITEGQYRKYTGARVL